MLSSWCNITRKVQQTSYSSFYLKISLLVTYFDSLVCNQPGGVPDADDSGDVNKLIQWFIYRMLVRVWYVNMLIAQFVCYPMLTMKLFMWC